MFYLMISIYTLLAIKFRKHRIVLMFLLLQIVSLASVMIIKLEDYSEFSITLFNVLFSVVITLPIILPFKNYSEITIIRTIPTYKFHKLSRVLFIIGGFSFIILLITALYVNILISDINAFRHEEGMATQFYYQILPFDVRFFIFAYSMYYLSYFFIPLHFYSLYIGDRKRANLYFLFSLNLILFGLTFFSRWTIVLFILLYVAHWVCYKQILSKEIRKKEFKWMTILASLLTSFFIIVTVSRFSNDTVYENETMNQNTMIKNTALYSVFDYIGKSNSRSLYYLKDYNGRTFGGRYLLTETQNFFSILRIVPPSDIEDYRDKIWTEYKGTFRTYACYTIFDVGLVFSLVISIIIFLMISRKGKVISFDKFIVSSLFMMVPICSIFFSYLNVFFFCLILYGFIKLYLKLV